MADQNQRRTSRSSRSGYRGGQGGNRGGSRQNQTRESDAMFEMRRRRAALDAEMEQLSLNEEAQHRGLDPQLRQDGQTTQSAPTRQVSSSVTNRPTSQPEQAENPVAEPSNNDGGQVQEQDTSVGGPAKYKTQSKAARAAIARQKDPKAAKALEEANEKKNENRDKYVNNRNMNENPFSNANKHLTAKQRAGMDRKHHDRFAHEMVRDAVSPLSNGADFNSMTSVMTSMTVMFMMNPTLMKGLMPENDKDKKTIREGVSNFVSKKKEKLSLKDKAKGFLSSMTKTGRERAAFERQAERMRTAEDRVPMTPESGAERLLRMQNNAYMAMREPGNSADEVETKYKEALGDFRKDLKEDSVSFKEVKKHAMIRVAEEMKANPGYAARFTETSHGALGPVKERLTGTSNTADRVWSGAWSKRGAQGNVDLDKIDILSVRKPMSAEEHHLSIAQTMVHDLSQGVKSNNPNRVLKTLGGCYGALLNPGTTAPDTNPGTSREPDLAMYSTAQNMLYAMTDDGFAPDFAVGTLQAGMNDAQLFTNQKALENKFTTMDEVTRMPVEVLNEYTGKTVALVESRRADFYERVGMENPDLPESAVHREAERIDEPVSRPEPRPEARPTKSLQNQGWGRGTATQPAENRPETNRPETNRPETNRPETNRPETNRPVFEPVARKNLGDTQSGAVDRPVDRPTETRQAPTVEKAGERRATETGSTTSTRNRDRQRQGAALFTTETVARTVETDSQVDKKEVPLQSDPATQTPGQRRAAETHNNDYGRKDEDKLEVSYDDTSTHEPEEKGVGGTRQSKSRQLAKRNRNIQRLLTEQATEDMRKSNKRLFQRDQATKAQQAEEISKGDFQL